MKIGNRSLVINYKGHVTKDEGQTVTGHWSLFTGHWFPIALFASVAMFDS
jgi:hypothetical protein